MKYKGILAIIIAVNLFSIIYCFSMKKEGWHSDEVWSYGFANSFYKAHINSDNDGNETNICEWVDNSVLNDYIEVNDGERFRFDSVYNNQIKDLSPPLHSMILHAICSFFPNTFSWWYSFAINIMSFIVASIFLYKTAVIIKNENFGLICCFLYGISMAARDTYIYLRMYAMCTALTMILFYNMTKYIGKACNDKSFINKNLIGVFISSLMMFWTHYYMITLVGIITICVIVIFLCRKDIKHMFVYGGMQLLSLGIALALFPSVVTVFLNHQSAVTSTVNSSMDYRLPAKLKVMADFLLYKLYGIHISVFMDFIWLKASIFVIISIIIVLMPLVLLLRKTVIIKKLQDLIKNIIRKLRNSFLRLNKIYAVLFVSIVTQSIIVAVTSQVYNMGVDEGRYLMYLYPLETIFFTGVVYSLIEKIVSGKKTLVIMCILSLGLSVINIYTRSINLNYYYLKNTTGETLESVVMDKNCIFISNESWAAVYMAPILRYSNEYFQTYMANYSEYGDEYEISKKEDTILLVDVTSFLTLKNINNFVENGDEIVKKSEDKYNDIMEYYKKIYNVSSVKRVSTQVVFGRVVDAYVFQ